MSIFSRWTARLLMAAMLAAEIAAVVLRQTAIGRLRDDQKTLLAEKQEAAQLAGTGKGVPALRAAAAEAEKLRQENEDLPKLRNDVRQLRRQADELAKLQTEHTRLADQMANIAARGVSAAFPEGTIMASSIRDSGTATPEAALQTFFWVISHADRQRLLQIATPEAASELANENDDELKSNAAEITTMLAGYRILDRKENSPDDVTLMVQLAGGGAPVPPQPFSAVRVGGEWKITLPK